MDRREWLRREIAGGFGVLMIGMFIRSTFEPREMDSADFQCYHQHYLGFLV